MYSLYISCALSLQGSSKSSLQSDDVVAKTILLLEKIEILEKKLNTMESDLQVEKEKRVKLEEENKEMKNTWSKAGNLLQSFASKVYNEFDIIPKTNSQESLLNDSKSQKSFLSVGVASRSSRQSIRSNSSYSSVSSSCSTNVLDH